MESPKRSCIGWHTLGVGTGVTVGDGITVGVGLGVIDGVGLALGKGLGVTDGIGDTVGVGLGLMLGAGDTDELGETSGVGVGVTSAKANDPIKAKASKNTKIYFFMALKIINYWIVGQLD